MNIVEKVEIRKEYLDQEIEKVKPKILKYLKGKSLCEWAIGKYVFNLTTLAGNNSEINYIHQKLSQLTGLTQKTLKDYKLFYSLFPNLPKLVKKYSNVPLSFYYKISRYGIGESDVEVFLKKNKDWISNNEKVTINELLDAARKEGIISSRSVPAIYCEICGYELPEEQRKNIKFVEDLLQKGWRVSSSAIKLDYKQVDCEWRYHAICDNCWNTIVVEKSELLKKMGEMQDVINAQRKEIERLRNFMFKHGLMVVFDE